MAHDVFVSYSQQDKAVADAVVARLEQEETRCWIAPRDITPGTSWGEAIVEAIAGSRIMVLVLSAESNRSRQVIREVQRAVADDVIILPFRIDDTDPTGAMAYFLGTEHWLDALTPPMERHIAKLQRTVATLLAGDEVTDLDTPPAAVRSTRRPRWLPYAIGGTAAAIVAAIALAVVLSGGEPAPTPTTPPVTTTATTTTTTTIPVGLVEAGGYQPIDLDPTDARAPDAVYGIDAAGSTLIYAGGLDGVTSVSVGDAANPRPMSTYAAYDAREVAYDGTWVYTVLGEYTGELLIFGLDGEGGVTLETTAGDLSSLTAADGHLYVSSHDYVAILDVTDPADASLVWEWEPPGRTGNPATTFVADGIGYFGAGWDGLYVFDVSDPSSPIALSHWVSPNWVTGLTVSDGLAYVCLGETGLAILDVADPARPALLGLAEVPGFAGRVVVDGGHAFVAWYGTSGGLGGVAVVDARDPVDPVFVETYGRFQQITGLELVDGHVIVSDEAAGLVSFEITGAGR